MRGSTFPDRSIGTAGRRVKIKVGGEDAVGDRGLGVACEFHTDAEIP